jgi:hypothetical protein
MYDEIYANYLEGISDKGLKLDPAPERQRGAALEKLRQKGVTFRNETKVFTSTESPACEACRKGMESVTFFISLMCHRHCYYCFNPNQENYDYFSKNKRDYKAELLQLAKSGQKLPALR